MSREIFDAIREAMLEAQADYLEEAAKATTSVESVIAHVIAAAFEKRATNYKIVDEARVGINEEAYETFVQMSDKGEVK